MPLCTIAHNSSEQITSHFNWPNCSLSIRCNFTNFKFCKRWSSKLIKFCHITPLVSSILLISKSAKNLPPDFLNNLGCNKYKTKICISLKTYPSIIIKLASWDRTLEIPLNSLRLLVEDRSFCIQHLPCLVSFPCMLKGSLEVWTKIVLNLFNDGQTRFGMPRGCENKFGPQWIETLPPSMHYKWKKSFNFVQRILIGN